jgi:hypothetical protein
MRGKFVAGSEDQGEFQGQGTEVHPSSKFQTKGKRTHASCLVYIEGEMYERSPDWSAFSNSLSGVQHSREISLKNIKPEFMNFLMVLQKSSSM